MSYNYKNFIEKLNLIFNKGVKHTKNTVTIKTNKILKYNFNEKDFNKVIKSKETNIEEFPITVQRGHVFPEDMFLVEDNKCSIQICKISDKQFVDNIMNTKNELIIVRNFFDYSNCTASFLNDLKAMLLLPNTNRYVAKLTKKRNFAGNAKDLVESYLVNLTINRNLVITLKSEEESNTPSISHKLVSFNNNVPIEMPKRRYNSEISRCFKMAKATNNPMLKYLSYYHVLEYYFNDVYNEFVIEQLKSIITSPEFSYKNNKCYEKILTKVQRHYTYNEKRGAITKEKKALKLVLEKYIKVDNFMTFLNDSDGIYYKNSPTAFEDRQKTIIDPNESGDKMFEVLTNRVYSTRNALVHNKDNGLISFVPFRDEFKISLEIPLIRFLAKEVLINSSEII